MELKALLQHSILNEPFAPPQPPNVSLRILDTGLDTGAEKWFPVVIRLFVASGCIRYHQCRAAKSYDSYDSYELGIAMKSSNMLKLINQFKFIELERWLTDVCWSQFWVCKNLGDFDILIARAFVSQSASPRNSLP